MPHTDSTTARPGQIVIATGNPHKVEEISAIFARLGLADVQLLNLSQLPGAPFPEPAETGDTFDTNAAIKATTYAKHTQHWCLADDSGLEVDALGGRPGVISSHYCTDGEERGMPRAERDQRNNERVLRELANMPPTQRTARFLCIMALAHPAGSIIARARGAMEGRIGAPPAVPRGDNGFGYDPLFLVAPEYTRTSAQLDPAEKNRLSHRAHAAAEMAEQLRAMSPA